MLASTDSRYWNLVFARSEINDLLIDAFVRLDPARFPQPELERFLYFNRERGGEKQRGELFDDGTSGRPLNDPTAWIADHKRRLFFESAEGQQSSSTPVVNWHDLLPYRYEHDYLEVLRGNKSPAALLTDLIEGLSRSDGLDLNLVRDYLALMVNRSDKERLTILKRFPVSDFELKVAEVAAVDHLEMMPGLLELIHLSSHARLNVPLDLFELAMRLRDGLDPWIPELGSILEDLRSFKHLVLLSDSEDFIIVEDERRAWGLKREGLTVTVSPLEVG